MNTDTDLQQGEDATGRTVFDPAEVKKAVEAIRGNGNGALSIAWLQRKLKMGYTRASALAEALVIAGVLGGKDLDGKYAVVEGGEISDLKLEISDEGAATEGAGGDQGAQATGTVWYRPGEILVGANVRTKFLESEMAELREDFRAQGFREDISRLTVRPLEYRVDWEPNGEPSINEGAKGPALIAWKRDGVWRSVWEDFKRPSDAPWRLLSSVEDVKAALAWLPKVELVIGGRRYRAASDLGLEKVPCLVSSMEDAEMLLTQLLENVQRRDLTPLDEGLAYQQFLQIKPQSDLALSKKLGIPHDRISSRLAMANLIGTSAEKPLKDGVIGVGHAKILSRLAPELLDELVDRVLRPKFGPKPMPWPQLEVLVADEYQKDLRTAVFDPTDATLMPEMGACGECRWNSAVIAKTNGEPLPRVHMCTNTACFKKKTEAHYERWRREAEGAGKRVIGAVEAEQLWTSTGREVNPNSGYVELAEKPYPHELKDPTATVPSWKTLVKGREVPVCVALDRKGVVRELAQREVALAAARENKHEIFKGSHAESVGTQEAPKAADPIERAVADVAADDSRKRSEAEAEAAREEFERVWSAQVAAVRRAIEDRPEPPKGTMWGLYQALRDCFIDGVSVAAGERGLDSEDFEVRVGKGSESYVLGAIWEMMVGQHFWENEIKESPLLKGFAKLYEVKLGDAAREAKKQLAKERAERAECEHIANGMRWVTKRVKAQDFTWEGKVCVDPDVMELGMPADSPVLCSVRVGRSGKGWFWGNWHALQGGEGAANRPVHEQPPEYGTRELAVAAALRDLIEQLGQLEESAPAVARLKAYLEVISTPSKKGGLEVNHGEPGGHGVEPLSSEAAKG